MTTQHLEIQQHLRASAHYGSSLIEASLDPLVTIDAEGRISDVNRATEEATGRPREELIGSDFADCFTEPERAREGYLKVWREGSVRDYPLAIRHVSGRVMPVLYNATLYRDESGRVVGVFAAARDVTELKKVEDALRYYAAIVESSDDAIIGKSLDGTISSWNGGAERMFGYSRDEAVGRPIAIVIPEEYQAEEEMIMARIRAGQPVSHYETVRRRKDGRRIDISVSVSPVYDSEGRLVGASKIARDISDRIRTESRLRVASLYARSLIEASLDPLVTIDRDGKITDVNRATEEATGVSRGQLVGTDFSDYFTEPERARDGYQKVWRDGSVRDYPLAIRHLSGRVMPVLYNATLYRNEAGEPQGIFAAARDITERKRAEEHALEASRYARSLIEASLDPLVTIDRDGKITDVNRATEEATGRSRAQLVGTDFCDYFTEPERARLGYQQVWREGVVWDYPLAIRHVSGRVTDVLYNASLYRDDRGEVQGVFAAARDITEQKQAEDALRAASRYARSLIEASLDPLVTIDRDGKIMDVNKGTEQATGYDRERLIGSDFSDYFTEPERALEGYQKVWREGSVRDYPLAIRHASGRVTDVLYNATLYRDDRGEVQGIFAAARDITERKRAEEQALAASRYARSLIEASLDPLVTIDRDGKITDVNRATEEATGVSRSQLVGTDFSDYFTESERAREGYQTVWRDGSVRDYPLAIRHVSGRVTDVLYNASLYRDDRGEVQGIFAAARDITERKRAEEALRRARDELEQRVVERTAELAEANAALQADIAARVKVEEALRTLNETLEQRVADEVASNREKDLLMIQQSRYAAMGEMIGNIAHQWRQPINALGLILANVKDAYQFGELSDEYVEKAYSDGNRLIQKMSTTINDFRDFFRPDKERRPFSALAQIREATQLVEASFKNASIKVVTEGEQDLRLIGYPNEYSQVLLNLLSNAKEAIVSHGVEAGEVRFRLESRDGSAYVHVSDNGGGIPGAVLDKIFDPYFSTKPSGTGIGLYMSKMIVEKNMGGRLLARNVGEGAEFTIITPLAEPEEAAP